MVRSFLVPSATAVMAVILWDAEWRPEALAWQGVNCPVLDIDRAVDIE